MKKINDVCLEITIVRQLVFIYIYYMLLNDGNIY